MFVRHDRSIPGNVLADHAGHHVYYFALDWERPYLRMPLFILALEHTSYRLFLVCATLAAFVQFAAYECSINFYGATE